MNSALSCRSYTKQLRQWQSNQERRMCDVGRRIQNCTLLRQGLPQHISLQLHLTTSQLQNRTSLGKQILVIHKATAARIRDPSSPLQAHCLQQCHTYKYTIYCHYMSWTGKPAAQAQCSGNAAGLLAHFPPKQLGQKEGGREEA